MCMQYFAHCFMLNASVKSELQIVSVKSKLQYSPPQAYSGHLTPLSSPGRKEFDYESLPGGGEFEPWP